MFAFVSVVARERERKKKEDRREMFYSKAYNSNNSAKSPLNVQIVSETFLTDNPDFHFLFIFRHPFSRRRRC